VGGMAGAFWGVADPGSREELGMDVPAAASAAAGRGLEAREKNC